MRKFSFGFACCVAAAALLGGCKAGESSSAKCCGGDCKDKAAVQMDASATPASEAKTGCCKGDAAAKSGCCKDKAASSN